MIVLLAKALATVVAFGDPNVGRLVTPRSRGSLLPTAASGVRWACDNDGYGAWDTDRYLAMLDRLAVVSGALFVTAPDVVGDAEATRARWDEWIGRLRDRNLPAAYVLQDGERDPPWDEARAVFVGGTTAFKLSPEAAALVAEAKARGLWTHMGRVNTRRRIQYAGSLGIDSIDGSSLARWANVHMDWARAWAATEQGSLFQ